VSTAVQHRHSFNIQDDEDFHKRVIRSSTPVIIQFHAPWCGPCKILGPRMETAVGARKGKVMLAKCDIDEHTEIAMDFGVTAVPQCVAVDNGREVARFTGLRDADQIETFIDKLDK